MDQTLGSLDAHRQYRCCHSEQAQCWSRLCAVCCNKVLARGLFEKCDACVRIARKRARLNIWLGWIAAVLNLVGRCDYNLRMPCPGPRLYQSAKHFVPQYEHKDFDLWALTGAWIPYNWNCREASVCIGLLEPPAIWFLLCSENARVGKHSSSAACHNSGILRICWAYIAAAYSSGVGRKPLFTLSYIPYSVSYISLR